MEQKKKKFAVPHVYILLLAFSQCRFDTSELFAVLDRSTPRYAGVCTDHLLHLYCWWNYGCSTRNQSD